MKRLVEYCNDCKRYDDVDHSTDSGDPRKDGVISSALALSEQLLCSSGDGTRKSVALAFLQKDADDKYNACYQKDDH